MDSALIAAGAGAVVSVLFEHVPGLREWFDARDSRYRKLFMLVAMVATGVALLLGSCYGAPWAAVDCSIDGVWDVVAAVFGAIALAAAAAAGNQGVHHLTKRDG